jgi:PPP family 3-phenylpropionic acid transporter
MPAFRRVALAYIVYYTAVGASFPYLPVFYRASLHLDLGAVGAITAVQAATSLVAAPLWGGLVDRFPRSRLTHPAAAVLAAAGAAILVVAHDLQGAVAGGIILFAGLAGTGPILDARVLELLGSDRARFGQFRAWGSAAFVVSAWVIGIFLDRADARGIFVVYLPALVLTAIALTALPRRKPSRSVSVLRGAGTFLGSPGVGLFLLGTFLVWLSLTGLNAFYSIQIVALGGGSALVGIGWAVGAIVEVPLMLGFARLARRFGTERLIVFGAFVFGVRALAAALVRDPVALVAIAPLEGTAFACFFVGGVTYLAARAPAGLAATAQGMFAAVAGLASIVGAGAGGFVADALTIPGLFGVSAAVAFGSAIVMAVAVRPARPSPIASSQP